MDKSIDFSIIIPQRDAIDSLPQLFNSIPNTENIEVFVIDNTPTPISKKEIGIDQPYELLWSEPSRHAGGARNVGLDKACGKWLLFADADDYFAEGAFELFYQYIDMDVDIVYFTAQGVYSDTGELSNRGDHYTALVQEYLHKDLKEEVIKAKFSVPWAKMIRRSMVEENHIRFEEIRASNDVMFSLLTGFAANKIAAVDSVVYIVTTRKGSLTRRRDLEIIEARFGANLRRNKFLKENNYSNLQSSVMLYIQEALRFGIKPFMSFLWLSMKYRQNIFIGFSRWPKTYINNIKNKKKESKYIIR